MEKARRRCVGRRSGVEFREGLFDLKQGLDTQKVLSVLGRPHCGQAFDEGADAGEQLSGRRFSRGQMDQVEKLGVGHESGLRQVAAPHKERRLAFADDEPDFWVEGP